MPVVRSISLALAGFTFCGFNKGFASRASSYKQSAIGYGFRNSFVFCGAGEQLRSSDCRPRFTKRRLVRIDQSEARETKVAHRPGRRANIERIARGNHNHAETIEFSRCWQAAILRPFLETIPLRRLNSAPKSAKLEMNGI